MYIYSPKYRAVVYVPATNDIAEKAAGVAIWIVPGEERNGDCAFGIDVEG